MRGNPTQAELRNRYARPPPPHWQTLCKREELCNRTHRHTLFDTPPPHTPANDTQRKTSWSVLRRAAFSLACPTLPQEAKYSLPTFAGTHAGNRPCGRARATQRVTHAVAARPPCLPSNDKPFLHHTTTCAANERGTNCMDNVFCPKQMGGGKRERGRGGRWRREERGHGRKKR